ncbi:DEKNAAC102965 [Brettanomyces naardenensis]|uniref:Ubiquitin carboxyl-terminal hydrolase n=1 Tax=Brettanomyces naardenensis TaxID=13370 RepID=A0A448YM64_BRENA|nr:DEKNAAC102965 [Brettanomyces naardenensis]
MTQTETAIATTSIANTETYISSKDLSISSQVQDGCITIKNDKLLDTANPTTILSERDEQRFQDNLVRNKEFKVLTLSRFNKHVSHSLPLYFGTNETEFSIYRKRALRNRRLSANPKYPDGEVDGAHYHKRISTRNLKVRIRIGHSKGAFVPPLVSRGESGERGQLADSKGTEKPKGPVKPIESIEPKEVEEHKEVKESQEAEEVKETTPQPRKPSAPVTPVPSAAPSTPGLKWSEAIQKGLLRKSSSNGSSPISHPMHSNEVNGVVNRSTPPTTSTVSTSSRSASASSTTNADSSISSTTPFVGDDSLKSLGLVALKVMYNPGYLTSVIEHRKSDLIFPHGLLNTGSICYMNSVLQMLFECQPFSQLLNIVRDNTVASFDTSRTPLIDALLLLHDSFKKHPSSDGEFASKSEAINPLAFYTSISRLDRFHNLEWGRQEDAEEFLGFLLDGLHEEFIGSVANVSLEDAYKFSATIQDKEAAGRIEDAVRSIKSAKSDGYGTEAQDDDNQGGWNEVGSNRKISVKRTFEFKPSPIAQLFGGQFRSILQVPNSKKSSITLDPFMHVQLDISDPETSDLVTAFKKFAEVEEISYGNQRAKKQNLIDKLPKILIIHLKRFSFVTIDEGEEGTDYEVVSSKRRKHALQSPEQEEERTKKPLEGRIEKIHKRIAYEHELTLPSSCISAMAHGLPKYRLIGVIYHHGRTAEGGHYTADVLEPSGDWIRIDDTQISKISSNEVIENGISGGTLANNSKSAYLLMYQQIS